MVIVSHGSTQGGDPKDLSGQAHSQEPVAFTLPEGSVCRAIGSVTKRFHKGSKGSIRENIRAPSRCTQFGMATGRRPTRLGCARSSSPIGAQLLVNVL